MDIKITPKLLSGAVTVPPSKSVAHRMMTAAALAKGESVIEKVYPSKVVFISFITLDSFISS